MCPTKNKGKTEGRVKQMKTVIGSIGILLWLLFCNSFSYAEQEIELGEEILTRDELEERVDKLIDSGNVILRRDVDAVFALGRIYEDEGNIEEAIQLYDKALRVNAWNLEYQLRLAKLLKSTERGNEAAEKARLVYDYAENPKLIQEAESFIESIGKNIDTGRSPAPVNESVEIVLVPLGNVEAMVLDELRYWLEKKMGIKYSIYEKTKDIGKMDRTQIKPYIEYYFTLTEESVLPEGKRVLLDELSLKTEDLELIENKIKFIRAFLDKIGDKNPEIRKNFEEGFEKMSSLGQYNTARLLPELRREFTIKKGAAIKGYLAVTGDDIYEGESNFLFGGALPGYGVMSYHRFAAKFTEEDQNRPRLVERIAKQGVSSSFFILGIPRCSNPICVRAYPHSLSEHDQKKFELCDWCKEKLKTYIKMHSNK